MPIHTRSGEDAIQDQSYECAGHEYCAHVLPEIPSDESYHYRFIAFTSRSGPNRRMILAFAEGELGHMHVVSIHDQFCSPDIDVAYVVPGWQRITVPRAKTLFKQWPQTGPMDRQHRD